MYLPKVLFKPSIYIITFGLSDSDKNMFYVNEVPSSRMFYFCKVIYILVLLSCVMIVFYTLVELQTSHQQAWVVWNQNQVISGKIKLCSHNDILN